MHKRVTEKQRHRWSAIVIVAGLSTLPTSLSLLVVTVYIRFVVDEELELVQDTHTAALPYFLAVTGTINFLGNLMHLSTMARAHRPSSRAAAVQPLFIAIIIDLGATLIVFSGCIFCFVQMALLPSSFQEGLNQAMRQYSIVPHIKVRLDELQMNYACCGDSGYQDWFQVPWVPEEILVVDPNEVQARLTDGAEYTNDDVPFSCCDPSSPRPCIHHHVTTNHLHFRYDYRMNTTLYATGCRQALMDFFGHILLRHVALVMLFLVLLQMSILAMSRLLQTSMQNAIALGDITAPAVGYLFSPPEDKGLKKDEETGAARPKEKTALLESGGEMPTSADTTDTEAETTTEEPGSGPSSVLGEAPNPYSTDLDTTPATDDEPLYENIPAAESMYDDIGGPWATAQRQSQPREEEQFPLFPSEMEENSNLNYYPVLARHRSGSSKAFNSLGISPPYDPAVVSVPTHHRFPPGPRY